MSIQCRLFSTAISSPTVHTQRIDAAVAVVVSTARQPDVERELARGRGLLDVLYSGDVDAFRSKSAKASPLRDIARQCCERGVRVSTTTLSRAINLAIVTAELPANAAFNLLPYSKRVALLPLRSSGDMEEFAMAVENRSVRAIAELVAERTGAVAASGGRRSSPDALRRVRVALRALADASVDPEVLPADRNAIALELNRIEHEASRIRAELDSGACSQAPDELRDVLVQIGGKWYIDDLD